MSAKSHNEWEKELRELDEFIAKAHEAARREKNEAEQAPSSKKFPN